MTCQEETEQGLPEEAVQEQDEDVVVVRVEALAEWAEHELVPDLQVRVSALPVGQRCPTKPGYHATSCSVPIAERPW
jgi:hypothetical protein